MSNLPTLHTHPRYCTWIDEMLKYNKINLDAGLIYGVYDHKENQKVLRDNATITSYHDAKAYADELNSKLDNPYLW
jgi:hypothetical protein